MRVIFTKFMGMGIVGGLALLLCPLSSNAITLDLTTGIPGGGGPGNSFSVSNNGISATVRAFSSADSAPTFLAAALNVNAAEGGVGVCNSDEVLDCVQLRDAVGNVDFIREFVLVDFHSPVFLKEAIITAQGSTSLTGTDTDASFFVGTGSTPEFLTLTPADLGTVFNDNFNDPGGILPEGTPRTLNLSSQVSTEVDWLLLGANLTDTSPEDFFRVTSVSVGAIPEPSTFLLFGTGFAGLWLYTRKRNG